jgi:hypothetical protein
MSISYDTTLRNTRMNDITTAFGSVGVIHIYGGARPATGASVASTSILCTIALPNPFAAAASGGVLTANAISAATVSSAGTAVWFRGRGTAGAFVLDGGVGTASTASAQMVISTLALAANVVLTVNSFVLTEGNP